MYYTYYSFETDKGIDGLGYIGYRRLRPGFTPENEPYWGTPSSPKNKAFRNNPNKDKIILGVFETKQEAIDHEIFLHELWSVDTNEHFANVARSISRGFASDTTDYTLRDWVNDSLNIIEPQITTKDLCEKYQLNRSKLSAVTNERVRSVNGWRLVGTISDSEAKAKKAQKISEARKDHVLRDWTNDALGITELGITNYDLREKYRLKPGALSNVVNQKERSCQGWRLIDSISDKEAKLLTSKRQSDANKNNPKITGKNNSQYNTTLKDWTNDKLGITEYQITLYDLRKKYNLSQGNLSHVFYGRAKSYKGWRLLEN